MVVRSTALRTMSEARFRKLYKLKEALESQSEDCLYLNVYAPEGTLFLVMVTLPDSNSIH